MITTSQIAGNAAETATASESKNPRVAAFQRIFEKVCEQLNFNERERAWFRDLLKDEPKQQ